MNVKHALISFSTANRQLLRIMRYGVSLLLIATIAAWIVSYFYIISINFQQYYPSTKYGGKGTTSVCILYGKIYCYQNDLYPLQGEVALRTGKVSLFLRNYRIYFRRAALNDPWSEFMGYDRVHFCFAFWKLFSTEIVLLIAFSRLQRFVNLRTSDAIP